MNLDHDLIIDGLWNERVLKSELNAFRPSSPGPHLEVMSYGVHPDNLHIELRVLFVVGRCDVRIIVVSAIHCPVFERSSATAPRRTTHSFCNDAMDHLNAPVRRTVR